MQLKDNFLEQCRLIYRKIKNMFAQHNATMSDIVRATVYITDIQFRDNYQKCKNEAFEEATTLPAGTFVNVSRLAWPNMMFEVEATAVVAR